MVLHGAIYALKRQEKRNSLAKNYHLYYIAEEQRH